jgi:uncharacterized Ntn-hydrolase superfamily protein
VTYSIVARDPATGELGVAVQSHWFAAGYDVGWAEAGVGAVATQASVEVAHGPNGLALLREGRSAAEAVSAVLAGDEGAAHRQVAIVDAHGRAGAHTGTSCIPEAGHRLGDGFSVQANMMLRDSVWDAMHDAFAGASGDLAHRLLAALDAAEAEGGDVRGRQAAGIDVVRAAPTERPWEDVLLHLHVDDHPDPLTELRRLVDLKAAYDHLDRSEQRALEGDPAAAAAERAAALRLAPEATEIAFWSGVQQAAEGRLDDARRTLRPALAEHDRWAELLRRLVERRLVDLPAEALARLLDGS